MASCYHPSYKMRWLPECTASSEKQRIQNLAIHALESNCTENQITPAAMTSCTDKEDDDFIVLASKNTNQPQKSNLELELVSFFNDSNDDLATLNSYPNIKKAFIKYNTSLCSSGPVERLFSLAGFIHSPSRGCLSDTTFEKLVFMKGNKNFSD